MRVVRVIGQYLKLIICQGCGVPDMLREVEVKVLHENICGKMLSGYP